MSDGSHIPVLLNEAVEGLAIQPDGVYVDGTFGRGGHSRAVLARLSARGRLIALDRDSAAVAVGKQMNDARFEIAHASFSELRGVLRERGIGKVNGILLDLGVSSPQFDDAQRGFSFRFDAPLDMRMDTSRGMSAAEWLANATEQEIREVIKDYGEERFARQIAAAIVKTRTGDGVDTTRKLAGVVAQAVRTREPGQDPATRTFQALRIYINQELEELRQVLPQCVESLAAGGRLVVISFHSLEDRIVKQFMQMESRPPQLPRRLPVRAAEMPAPKLRLIGRAVKPTLEETQRNPRARSAIMRVAEKANEKVAA